MSLQRGERVVFDGLEFEVGHVCYGKEGQHVELIHPGDHQCVDLYPVEGWMDRLETERESA